MTRFKQSLDFDHMDGQYRHTQELLRNAGYSVAEAHLYGIAYMLQQLDTGIAILSKSDEEPVFHQHRTKTLSRDSLGLPITFETLKCK